jgi:TonB-linked SusC/RagA family outer membrane protein
MKNNYCQIIPAIQKIRKLKSCKKMKLGLFLLMFTFAHIFALPNYKETTKAAMKAENSLTDEVLKISEENNVTQQRRTISGKVTDENGEPLAGVTIVVKGTTQGTVTNAEGEYTLPNIPPNTTLVFSFVGMKTQEINVGDRTIINVTMETEAIGLEEVIAVGYATQKRVNVVGSITSVKGEKIEAIPASDITNTLAGRLAGAVIIQPSGEPGQTAARILVRGRTTLGDNTGPMVVIDGIPGRSLRDIDPVDIESISVLKDASAAIYGATAANGVILVTTKRGQTGKPRLNYQFYQGWATPSLLPKVTNAGDYATMLSEYQDYEGKPRTFSNRDIDLFYSGRDPWEHPNSDWMGDLIAKWNGITKHNVTVDGGTEKGINYFASFGYKTEDAIYKQESPS